MNLYEIVILTLMGVPGGLVLWLAIRTKFIRDGKTTRLVLISMALMYWTESLTWKVQRTHLQPWPGLIATLTLGTLATTYILCLRDAMHADEAEVIVE